MAKRANPKDKITRRSMIVVRENIDPLESEGLPGLAND
jgi:hypothetical protein